MRMIFAILMLIGAYGMVDAIEQNNPVSPPEAPVLFVD